MLSRDEALALDLDLFIGSEIVVASGFYAVERSCSR